MSSIEELRDKERLLFFYGVFTSHVKSQVKGFLRDFINSAIDDSRKKLSPNFPEDKTNPALEVMKASYLAAAVKHEKLLDAMIDSAFILPSEMAPEELSTIWASGAIDREIDELKNRAIALKNYGEGLQKMENHLSEIRKTNFDTYQERLQRINATYEQQRENFDLLCDLLSPSGTGPSTKELEDSVMNMSIG